MRRYQATAASEVSSRLCDEQGVCHRLAVSSSYFAANTKQSIKVASKFNLNFKRASLSLCNPNFPSFANDHYHSFTRLPTIWPSNDCRWVWPAWYACLVRILALQFDSMMLCKRTDQVASILCCRRRCGRLGMPGSPIPRSCRSRCVRSKCPAMSSCVRIFSCLGRLGIVDHDRVELSNLQRQILHNEDTLGMYKAESAALALKK